MHYTPPLHVYVVYHPQFAEGAAWALQLERWLSGDPDTYAVPAADIPTFIWTAHAPAQVPAAIPFGEAERTVVILLVDDTWMAQPTWRSWANSVAAASEAAGPTNAVVVAAASPTAFNLTGAFTTRNALRLPDSPAPERSVELRLRVTHLLARHLLGGARSSIFISHTKAGSGAGDNGGRDLALALEAFVNRRPLGTVFFDEVSIEAGDDFVDRLGVGVDASVVVVLLTDRFAGRFWCKWEVLTAKKLRRPMLLVDALVNGEPINLAYAGNVRTVRWSQADLANVVMHDTIIAGALLELVRSEHNKARARCLEPRLAAFGLTEVMGYGPELATLPPPGAATVHVLHPDPPLAAFEAELIRLQRPDVRFASITQALAGSANGLVPLTGRRVAISISDSPDRKLLGLTKLHQERLWERIASLLLSAGAQLAYGGDLRKDGYTERLWNLIRGALDAGGRLPAAVVHSYLGWPITLTVTNADRAQLPEVIELHDIPMPPALTCDPRLYISPESLDPQEQFAWTASMATMRRLMATHCDARVMVGGQLRSASPVPGLVDEFLTFSPGKPVYLAGGFGGMTRVIGRALLGESPPELTRAFQEDGGERTALMDYFDHEVASGAWAGLEPLDFDALVRRLNGMGIASLANGLTDAENLRLFWSKDILEITSLVLTGLRRCFGAPQPSPSP